jgi:hypothetical protein
MAVSELLLQAGADPPPDTNRQLGNASRDGGEGGSSRDCRVSRRAGGSTGKVRARDRETRQSRVFQRVPCLPTKVESATHHQVLSRYGQSNGVPFLGFVWLYPSHNHLNLSLERKKVLCSEQTSYLGLRKDAMRMKTY